MIDFHITVTIGQILLSILYVLVCTYIGVKGISKEMIGNVLIFIIITIIYLILFIAFYILKL